MQKAMSKKDLTSNERTRLRRERRNYGKPPATYTGRKYKILRQIPLSKLYEKALSTHARLRVFAEKGLKCVSCDRVGTQLLVTLHKDNGVHIDLYTETGTLMTVDHIIPKCKGGHKKDIRNLQPMCTKCNTEKSGVMPGIPVQQIYGGLIPLVLPGQANK